MSGQLAKLPIIDIRSKLPRRPERALRRVVRPADSVTLHYNGPKVDLHDNSKATLDAWIAHLVGIATYHIDKVWGYQPKTKVPIYGDGIMYPLVVLPGGEILLTYDLDRERWHCGNAQGNRDSIAVHFPLGGPQDVTPRQWQAWDLLASALLADHQLTRKHVLGHCEWPRYDKDGKRIPQSACPGPLVMPRLHAWRAGRAAQRYRVLVDAANVREGPGRSFDVAWKGRAVLQEGFEFTAESLVSGEAIAGVDTWAHWPAAGFVHLSLLAPV